MIYAVVFLAGALIFAGLVIALLLHELTETERLWREQRLAAWQAVVALSEVHKPPTRDWVMKQPGVYVIRAHQWTKIGYASNVARRLDDYVVSIPRGYELIAVFYCEQPAELERKLHYRYQRMRRRGEWFSLSDATLAELQAEAEQYKGR